MGLNLNKGTDIRGRLEFDFIDFAKSSPTTQMNPRARIASITYIKNDYKFIIGQDWDLFSPVTTYTFDYVGLYFLAGNTGFQRQQLQVLKTHNDWEYGLALGMAGNNPGTIDNDLELSKSPSYALRISRQLDKGRIGFSAIYANLKYFSNQQRHDTYGLNFFFEKVLTDTSLKSEIYYGQNMANIGTLAIGRGTDKDDVREFGGTFTVQQKITETDFIFGGLGFAKADNASEITPFSLNASNGIASPGIKSNFLSRLGWEKKLSPDLSWVTEISRYQTESKLPSRYQEKVAHSLESGMNLRF